mmetsp:Transcript_18602/g.46433  ORF Transcript_18602/g.46433 Transcript_18602/m.46433 type:complete len:121 (+) Transcript_18602:154-516(+)|eukprot:CAMPEP_0178996042 /NCGR_PEP_ID=MMETSP0795-20121207/8151_1 /TAXON_ID=88552 /ORGANISM="Amoebophrya sp., Strain Ameob2" /LENGTH=120 /DNA_ID=CAMNT_0020688393 /DNA_START=131 /DNA_END=493 /DNA_ORIENTATION=+
MAFPVLLSRKKCACLAVLLTSANTTAADAFQYHQMAQGQPPRVPVPEATSQSVSRDSGGDGQQAVATGIAGLAREARAAAASLKAFEIKAPLEGQHDVGVQIHVDEIREQEQWEERTVVV